MAFRTYKTYANKNSTNEDGRWDHSGFEQLERENRYQKHSENPIRRKNFGEQETEKTSAPVNNEAATSHTLPLQDKTNQNYSKGKHFRDKRRPDRVLYKPPKQRDNLKEIYVLKNSPTASNIQKDDQLDNIDAISTTDGKNLNDLASLDEERCSFMSESTNNSDKTQTEEIVVSKFEPRNSSILSAAEISPKSKRTSSQPLFELTVTLYDGSIAEFKLFDAEDDYENLIDLFCIQNQIEEEDCFPMKIQIVKYMLADKGLDSTRLTALFEKLLEANYELLIRENSSVNELQCKRESIAQTFQE